MDPRLLGPEQWGQIGRLLPHFGLFVALMVNMAMSFLLAHAILPSLAMTRDLPEGIAELRRILYPISAISMVLAAITLARAIVIMVAVLEYFYPRFAI
jgi:hypothetical protein